MTDAPATDEQVAEITALLATRQGQRAAMFCVLTDAHSESRRTALNVLPALLSRIAAQDARIAHTEGTGSPGGLQPDERLIWLLGDLMNDAENFYGAPNPKREGHIYCAANRILDEVIEPIRTERDTLRAELAALRAHGDMVAFGASERACYDYPDDTDIAKAQRAAFCAGAAWPAGALAQAQADLAAAQAVLEEIAADHKVYKGHGNYDEGPHDGEYSQRLARDYIVARRAGTSQETANDRTTS